MSFFASSAHDPRCARSTDGSGTTSLSGHPFGPGNGRDFCCDRAWSTAGTTEAPGIGSLWPIRARMGVRVVAIDPSPSFRKAFKMCIPLAPVDHVHVVPSPRTPEPTPASTHHSKSRAAMAGASTKPGPTGYCSCVLATSSTITQHTFWLKSPPPTSLTASCKPRGKPADSCGNAPHEFRGRRGRCERNSRF